MNTNNVFRVNPRAGGWGGRGYHGVKYSSSNPVETQSEHLSEGGDRGCHGIRYSSSNPVETQPRAPERRGGIGVVAWPLHNIAITNTCGVYCNNGGSGVNIMLRNSVGDDGGGVPKQRVCVQRIGLILAQKRTQNNILWAKVSRYKVFEHQLSRDPDRALGVGAGGGRGIYGGVTLDVE